MDADLSFGRWLKRRRRGLGLTQAQLGQQVGYAGETIRKVESDELRPSRQLAEKLAETLGIADADHTAFLRFARDEQGDEEVTLPTQTVAIPQPPVRPLHNLPLPRDWLIGRRQEVAAVQDLLLYPTVGLVTLAGPGGVGKTRLALQVAANLLDHAANGAGQTFPDGVYFVPLAAIDDPALVLPTLAQTWDLREVAGRPLQQSVQEYLRDKQMLLVLDNFEQVAAAGPQISALLQAAPRLKVLITSRIILHLRNEHIFALSPLALPVYTQEPGQSNYGVDPLHLMEVASVHLFVKRAQAAQADFALTKQNAAAIAEICHRLDGLPLAIELAAARVRLLPPQVMLARLERQLQFLTSGARDAPARQQTMRATLAWSYALLNEAEKTLFRRLAIFVGGGVLEAVEAVCNADGVLPDVLEELSSLIDKSLLQQKLDVNSEPRFVLLRVIREYVLELLAESGETESLRQSHATYYLALAEQAEGQLWRENSAAWLERLDREHDNLRAALDYYGARADGTAAELKMAGSLWRFWQMRGYYTEGRRWLEKALTRRGEVDPANRWLALHAAGNLACDQGHYEIAKSYYAESLALLRALGDQRGVALSLINLGHVALLQGAFEQSLAFTEEAHAIHRRLNNRIGLALALNNLADIALYQGRYAQAESLSKQSLALYRELGDERGIGWSLSHLGTVARYRCAFAQAAQFYQESLLAFQKLKTQADRVWLLLDLGELARHQGDLPRAVALHEESLALAQETGEAKAIASALNGLAILAHERGDDHQAVAWCEQSMAIQREIGDTYGLAESLHNRGRIACDRQEYPAAWRYFQESLTFRQQLKEPRGIATSLEALATLASTEASGADWAVQGFSAAAALREAIGAPLTPIDRTRTEQMLAALQTALGAEAFVTAWTNGQALTVEQAITSALTEPIGCRG